MTANPDHTAAAASRTAGGGVEVRGAHGQFLFRATREEAEAAVAAGAGRWVRGGRVLRIIRHRAALAWLRNASRTVHLERVPLEATGRATGVWQHRRPRPAEARRD